MYNERKENFNLKSVILQFLFVALFIFVLMWLFPMKSDLKKALNTSSDSKNETTDLSMFYDQIFNNNVVAMKDAAKSYFTTPRLPQAVGDKVKLTLGEMLDKKIILPFVDSKGKQCDLDNSYVEITKYEDEFVMKVNLKCSDQENYLLVYMGCYDYCQTAICEKNKADIKTPVLYSTKTKQPVQQKVNNVTNIVNNINKERHKKINPAKKELERIDKELEKIDRKKTKLFEAYEEEVISKEEFKERKDELNKRAKNLQEEKEPFLVTLSDDVSEEIPYEFIKSILENFGKVLAESVTREQQKKLLHMIISEITINESREIDSIKLKINDSLVEYISKEEGVSIKGTPSSFMLKNVGVSTLNLDIAI